MAEPRRRRLAPRSGPVSCRPRPICLRRRSCRPTISSAPRATWRAGLAPVATSRRNFPRLLAVRDASAPEPRNPVSPGRARPRLSQRTQRLAGPPVRWRARALEDLHLDYGPSEGVAALREALASYLTTARGLSVSPDRIVITNGFQQAIDLAARVLLDAEDHVLMEELHYSAARHLSSAIGPASSPRTQRTRRDRRVALPSQGGPRPTGLRHALAPVSDRGSGERFVEGCSCSNGRGRSARISS